MKNVKWLAALFLLNNEVVSWMVLIVLALAALLWFFKEVENGAER